MQVFQADLFAGKTVLVCGATSGIGLAIAAGFSAHGADVLAVGSSQAKIDVLRVDPAFAGLRFVALDVRSQSDITACLEAEPRLNVVVNAQGIARPDDEFNDDVFADVIAVNLTSAMRIAMAARAQLARSGGCIINIASMLSYLGAPDVPAYGASKTGLLGLTRSLAHAFGPEGIRVNAIAPGYHRTAMTRPLWQEPQSCEAIARHAALRRWGTVDDLVGAALFLASPAASFITGADLPVDGGYLVGAVTG
ncbi:SDR family NAD(P)-dependent oxidoreductase [Lichenicoccus sp.]|uniref:SDR family NAD(P)-dependent oxidoreductase n=1 Tax=Lichenicoccus sp. TaxID=2781899 RepID=UPI003D13F37B